MFNTRFKLETSSKKLTAACLFTATIFTSSISSTAMATEFSKESSLTIASQYLFRGFDLSQGNPAIQGDYVVSTDGGFWFGAWGSTYEIPGEDGIEVDLMAGYDISLTEDLTLNLGVTEYTYSGASTSTTEFFVGMSYSNFSFTYYDDTDLNTTYLSGDAKFPVSEQVSIALHAGQYEYEDNSNSSDFSITGSYAVNDQFSVFAGFSSNDINVVGAEDYAVAGFSYSF